MSGRTEPNGTEDPRLGKVVLDLSMSLDGFVTGPNVGVDLPMGAGGLRLHRWLFDAKPDRPDAQMARESTATVGAMVIGRRMFDVGVGVWEDTPLPVPTFVVTHEARSDLAMRGGAFVFATDGVARAVGLAREAGLLDEIRIPLVPVLFGAGTRLFDGLSVPPVELERFRVIESPAVTHLWFRVAQGEHSAYPPAAAGTGAGG